MRASRPLLAAVLSILAIAPIGADLGRLHMADAAPLPAATITVQGGPNGTFGTTHGWAFTPIVPIVVTQLGFFDFADDGLTFAHQIGLWDTSAALLRSATVPAGTSAPLLASFRYVAIAPVSLTAGVTYVVGADFPGPCCADDFIGNGINGNVVAFDSRIASDGGRLAFTPFTFPAIVADEERFGPNFLIDTAVTVVPHPAALPLLATGAVVIGVALVRRRRSLVTTPDRAG